MGVRPPTQRDDTETPGTLAFGIAALDDHLERAEATFPATADELLDTLGDPHVPYDASGNAVQLSEVLDAAGPSRFETRQEFLNTVHPIFEAERQRAKSSFFGRLRSMLPF